MKFILKLVLFTIVLLVLYKTWFGSSFLSAGDWHFFFSTSLNGFIPGFWGWDPSYGNGLGGTDIYLLGLNSYFLNISFLFLTIMRIPWWFVERSTWYWPFICISVFSAYVLYKTFFTESSFVFLAIIIVLTNTYALMLIGGGQVGVAIAFSLAPLVLGLFARVVSNFRKNGPFSQMLFQAVSAGTILGVEIFFDLRIAYITLLAVVFFFIFFAQQFSSIKLVILTGMAFLIAFFLNIFWIFPQGLLHQNPLQQMGSAYDSLGAVKFFSFANFENAFGLLHPNWPENIFGKVGFMKPEFLLLPILAYGSLLFVDRKQGAENNKEILKQVQNDRKEVHSKAQNDNENMYVLYFALLGLVGTFLAKGAKDPFGGVYLWMFGHIPGFIMFRDPTKWYLLIVLSYSMLIPYTVGKIYEVLLKVTESKKQETENKKQEASNR